MGKQKKKSRFWGIFRSKLRSVLGGLSGVHLQPVHTSVLPPAPREIVIDPKGFGEQPNLETILESSKFSQLNNPDSALGYDFRSTFPRHESRFGSDEQIDQSFAGIAESQMIEHELLPDGHTLYISETGLAHGLCIASRLKHYGISSDEVFNRASSDPNYYHRYDDAIARYGTPGTVHNAKGRLIVLEGHSVLNDDDFKHIESRMPTIDDLKTTQITRVVVFVEANFGGRVIKGDSPIMHTGEGIGKYLHDLSSSGIELYRVGVDMRCEDVFKGQPEAV